jgi:hypothetical protein
MADFREDRGLIECSALLLGESRKYVSELSKLDIGPAQGKCMSTRQKVRDFVDVP